MPIDDVAMKVKAYRLKEYQYRKGWAYALGGEDTAAKKPPPPRKTMPDAARRRLKEMHNG